VLLLDMDGTLIGRITPQVCEYEVLMTLDKKKLRSMRADVVTRLKQGVMRPHLDWFVKQMGDAAELFVFTASEDKWAKFLVPLIEEALGVKFNRPIFTRNHCTYHDGEYLKSLDRVAPLVFKALKDRHRLTSVRDVSVDMLLVDNNHGVLMPPLPLTPQQQTQQQTQQHHADAERWRLIKCPTYDHAVFYDVLSRLDPAILHARFTKLVPILARFGMFPTNVSGQSLVAGGVQQFLSIYYARLSVNARQAWQHQDAELKDRMWRTLGEMLVALRSAPRVLPDTAQQLTRTLLAASAH